MNNPFIVAQIGNMIMMSEQFKKALDIAALKDDNLIDKKEHEYIKKLKAATDRYIAELQKLK